MEYWKQLTEEYSIEISPAATDSEVLFWAKEEEKQRITLINNYGESAWNIMRFAELLRAEKISESFFRQLVRYEMDKNYKEILIENNQWNTIDEKLPDNDRTVLVYKNDTETPHWSGYDLGTYQNENWYLSNGRPSHVIVEKWKEIE